MNPGDYTSFLLEGPFPGWIDLEGDEYKTGGGWVKWGDSVQGDEPASLSTFNKDLGCVRMENAFSLVYLFFSDVTLVIRDDGPEGGLDIFADVAEETVVGVTLRGFEVLPLMEALDVVLAGISDAVASASPMVDWDDLGESVKEELGALYDYLEELHGEAVDFEVHPDP